MPRRWRGPLVTENQQTGDGRVIAPGAITWAELPLPLAWLVQGDQHVMPGEAPQVGVIQTITRVGDDLIGEGIIDDTEGTDGAELVRRMEGGLASNGHRQLVSIDPDDWEVEVIDTRESDGDDEGLLLLASAGRGPVPSRVVAAAGDEDPGQDGGDLLIRDSADSVIERYTRMRIRGATACAVSAFTTAWIELVDEPAATAEITTSNVNIDSVTFSRDVGPPWPMAGKVAGFPVGPYPDMDACIADNQDKDDPAAFCASLEQDDDDMTAAVLRAALAQVTAPPAAAFTLPEPQPGDEDDGSVYGMPVQELIVEQPDGGLAVPFTIVERDGHHWCFGHAARWGQCHVGYPGQCVTAPESGCGYAHFHHGSVLTADGERVATGPLTMGTDHADADLLADAARDHYAHTGLAFADVSASNGALGIWVSGVLRPHVTDLQRHVIAASSLSGDWRRIGTGLEFISALAVNVPGFPIARELAAAAGLAVVPRAALAASAYTVDGEQRSLVAAGVVQRCPDCQRRAMAGRHDTGTPDETLRLLRLIESRTRHLSVDAAEHALRSIRRP